MNPTGLKLFLCGDVMTGRAIDQVLPHSVDPVIYEPFVKDAREYVWMAERKNGKIPAPVGYDYIWGDALHEWKKQQPDLKIINLETSITEHDKPWPEKIIQYRMHPQNIEVLTVAGIDCCSLANNHVLDWHYEGLSETIQVLKQANIVYAGAGPNLKEASLPAILKTPKGRVILLAYGSIDGGVPREWQADNSKPGINMLADYRERSVTEISEIIKEFRQPGDVVIFSIHWGSNWGHVIPDYHQQFAHALIDHAGVDLIFGHSSHHPRAMEVYKNKLIMYGAGDFFNDYEGISGHELFRGDLSLMYFPEIDTETGKLLSMDMIPMQIRNFRLNRASRKDAAWLAAILNQESRKLSTGVELKEENLSLNF